LLKPNNTTSSKNAENQPVIFNIFLIAGFN